MNKEDLREEDLRQKRIAFIQGLMAKSAWDPTLIPKLGDTWCEDAEPSARIAYAKELAAVAEFRLSKYDMREFIASCEEKKVSQQDGGRGGHLILQAGAGYVKHDAHGQVLKNFPPGDLILKFGSGEEFLRASATGEVLVRGHKVDNDRRVYECFREWLGVALASSGMKRL